MAAHCTGEFAFAEFFGLFFEVALDQRDLLFVRRVFNDDFLQAAVLQLLKHMSRLFEIKRHHLGAFR